MSTVLLVTLSLLVCFSMGLFNGTLRPSKSVRGRSTSSVEFTTLSLVGLYLGLFSVIIRVNTTIVRKRHLCFVVRFQLVCGRVRVVALYQNRGLFVRFTRLSYALRFL